jgi:DNA-binding NtrC family response regulator
MHTFDQELKEALAHRETTTQNAELTERVIMDILWRYRGIISVTEMANRLGWSRQTIYNKWEKYGYHL